jgi:hypothetical protein
MFPRNAVVSSQNGDINCPLQVAQRKGSKRLKAVINGFIYKDFQLVVYEVLQDDSQSIEGTFQGVTVAVCVRVAL